MALWKDGWKALGMKGEGGCGRGEWGDGELSRGDRWTMKGELFRS